MPCSSTRCPGRPPYVLFPLTAGQQGKRGNQNSGNREPEWSGWQSVRMGGSDNKGDGLASQPRRYRVPGQPLLNRHQVGGVSRSPDGLFAQHEWEPIRGRPPSLLCSPLSLLVRLPRSVCLCCSSSCLLALLGALVAHPLLSHPPAPPYEGFTSPYDVDYPVRGWLVTALLPPPWHAPPSARSATLALVEYVGTL